MKNLAVRNTAYQFFIGEAPELLLIIESGLLTLQQERTSATIHEIMRAAHSLKGGAASVGIEAIATLAHRLEDIFKAFYDETVEIDNELQKRLLQAYDCLKTPLLEQIANGGFDAEAALSSADLVLTQIEERLGDALKEMNNHLPSMIDMGVDMVASIFEVDVAQGLARLADVISHPHNYEVAGELRAQAEVFAGFAQMLNLPGFEAIAQTALAALNVHPDRALAIIQLALTDFQDGRTAVLEGDRTRGGSPSSALVALAQPSPQDQPVEEAVSLEDLFNFSQNSVEIDTTPSIESFAIDPNSLRSDARQQKAATIVPFPSSTKKNESSPPANLSIRVDINRLDRMNNLVGELAIDRNGLCLQNEQLQKIVRELRQRINRFRDATGQLCESDQNPNAPLDQDSAALFQNVLEEMMQVEEAVEDITLVARQSHQTLNQNRKKITSLNDEIMWARMLPIGDVLNRFPRTLHDLSLKYQKPVDLKISGTGVLVDKGILEKIYDPLLHLLRNAFDHGIEPSESRIQQGKPARGQIEICARHQGNQTLIEIKDDGRGLNLESIRQKALEKGLLSAEEVVQISDERVIDLIFEPGFSTASQANELSGRGVGLDIVRAQVRSLKGTVSVKTFPGEGTTFTLRFPLTLTIAKLLICFARSTALAIPADSIEEIVVPKAYQIKDSDGDRYLNWQEDLIPIYQINELLGYSRPLPESPISQSLLAATSPENGASPLLVLRTARGFVALEIERLGSERDLAIKPFKGAIAPPSYLYGCTIWGDGSLIPVIDGAALIEYTLASGTTKTVSPITNTAPTVLVVDDSITIRETLTLVLQQAGYRVLKAQDGWEAIAILKSNPQIKLVVSDIDMPQMNGFEFLSHRRQDAKLMKIPIFIFSSRSNDKHRKIALQMGANAYFIKPSIEDELLSAVVKLLGQPKTERSRRQQAA
jgi:two-component system, chemotaxis family, sensor histidine kinase and response regulator PixL